METFEDPKVFPAYLAPAAHHALLGTLVFLGTEFE